MTTQHPELLSRDHPRPGDDSAPAEPVPLFLSNACAAPLDAVPVFSFGYFRRWLSSRVRADSRVAAFFAVPEHLLEEGGTAPPAQGQRAGAGHRLFAVLADPAGNRLQLACADVQGRYPSLTPALPQLHLFEREIHEKYGLVPEGHPWLKPVRFEKTGGPEVGSMDFFRVNGDEVHEVAVGPIHAGVIECGHFRFQCLGELVMHLEISLGYHHRGVEAHLLRGPGPKTLGLMETLCGDTTIAHSWAYCGIVEALAHKAPSPRGQYMRALALELERLANHTGDMGALAGDVGFLPTASYCGRLRGDWLNMTAMLCGSRFGRGLLTPGGVRYDVDRPLLTALGEKLTRAEPDVDRAVKLMWNSSSVMARLTGIGVLSKDAATAIGAVGPAARASGLERDARHSHPMPGLTPPAERSLCSQGDVRARAVLRHREIAASAAFCKKLVREFLLMEDEEGTDDSRAQAMPAPGLAPRSLAVSLVEGWRGELCHVALTAANGRFARYVVVDPSFHNWMGLALAMRGQQISDFPLCNKSFNLSYCGHDL